jgi:hypothetical protein
MFHLWAEQFYFCRPDRSPNKAILVSRNCDDLLSGERRNWNGYGHIAFLNQGQRV